MEIESSSRANEPTLGTRGFVLERDFGESAAKINEFYNAFTGFSRSLDVYLWEWQSSPAGPGLVWTITDAATGQLVGHHGIVRTSMVKRGETMMGGRTENTVVLPGVRTKLFYPGMEKKALNQALEQCGVLYTVYAAGAHARVRQRLGYRRVGRWVAFVAQARRAFVFAALDSACKRLSIRAPKPLLRGLACLVWRRPGRRPPLTVIEIDDVTQLGEEYVSFWEKARKGYDLTIDRTLDFLRWRIVDNPHVAYRSWALRRAGSLHAVIIGYERQVGEVTVLQIEDVIAGDYSDEAFDPIVACFAHLDPESEAVLIHTLDVDTPLYRALCRKHPLQAAFLKRYADRFWDEFMGREEQGSAAGAWYVTPIFTEGLALRVQLRERHPS